MSGSIAGGMTARTTVHLAPLCDDLMSEMTKLRGLDASKIFYESHAASVDRIEEIQKSENIDCDFRRLDGYLFQGNGMPLMSLTRSSGASRLGLRPWRPHSPIKARARAQDGPSFQAADEPVLPLPFPYKRVTQVQLNCWAQEPLG